MRKIKMKLKSIIILLIICVSCKKETQIDMATTLPFYNSEEFIPEWIAESDENYNRIHTISQFEFTNQNGQKITNNDFEDKIYIADFFFTTCPSICPILAKKSDKLLYLFFTANLINLLCNFSYMQYE